MIKANSWVDAETSDYGAIERLFNFDSGKIGKYWGNKNCGFSIRYIKDLRFLSVRAQKKPHSGL